MYMHDIIYQWGTPVLLKLLSLQKIEMHTTKDPPIENQDTLQAQTRPMQRKLVVTTKS